MRTILVFGATGMLGHKVCQVLSEDSENSIIGTTRGENDGMLSSLKQMRHVTFKYGVNADNYNQIEHLIETVNPSYIINCIGAIPQKMGHMTESEKARMFISLNTVFPNKLVQFKPSRCKLIHISTDCVFSGVGKHASYWELDIKDAEDMYGITKGLGEINGKNVVTLRTSIIGDELFGSSAGLFAWFKSQFDVVEPNNFNVSGYADHTFSGLTTFELSSFIRYIIKNNLLFDADGIYNISAKPISKYDLLKKINEVFNFTINKSSIRKVVTGDNIDKSLSSEYLCEYLKDRKMSYKVPNWNSMIEEMKYDIDRWE